MEPILENYSMEIYAANIRSLKERMEAYRYEMEQTDAELKQLLQKKQQLQKGMDDLKQELREQERKKEQAESPAGIESRRLEEAKRQYREEKIERLALQSGPIQRLGLHRRSVESPGKEAKSTDTSIQRLSAHGPHFAKKFNALISGFVSEDSAKDKLTNGGKKYKTRKR